MSKPNKHKQPHKPVHYGKKSQQSPPKPVATKPTPTPEQATVQCVVDGKATLVFNATDTLFFRESRPMEALGEAQSVFPPPVRTLAGAVRTLIGEHFQVQWHEFDQKKGNIPLPPTSVSANHWATYAFKAHGWHVTANVFILPRCT
ncbi:type III-B CRISPR module-associated Cmr3 family protein [Thiothrix subterranea]|uniref:type III-B CRISPR module-associated Cmr3 family protein n=1 Tax=Thiothrix subterranea TaxID=2735563 RepID=UPI00280BB321|nr:type III-B CRISPR module-associated Cmr3 family protein [Thiothrix subterranea]